ncbi:hypothetical protein KT99_06037 [Shewanella benthica KT99]|uniref:Uncharacterized protein n=1 Tax=Shewanella benthica KT99 TaxID=314608 RepID=A9CVK2_9GAMM|nr:hypothetical protein KT99_06037 [Shewanella benthica KT99]
MWLKYLEVAMGLTWIWAIDWVGVKLRRAIMHRCVS